MAQGLMGCPTYSAQKDPNRHLGFYFSISLSCTMAFMR
jgi:hypothetical protein